MQILDFKKNKIAVKFQQGAAAIEFSLVFLIFFTLFYAIVSYAIIFLLKTSFHHAANEGARSAISIDHQAFANDSEYQDALRLRVRETVGNTLQWLPNKARTQVLGANNGKVEVTYVSNILTVRVFYPDYYNTPLIPKLAIPGLAPLYSAPGGSSDLAGSAVIRLV